MPFRSKDREAKLRKLVPVSRDVLQTVVGGRGENLVDRPEDAYLLSQTMVVDEPPGSDAATASDGAPQTGAAAAFDHDTDSFSAPQVTGGATAMPEMAEQAGTPDLPDTKITPDSGSIADPVEAKAGAASTEQPLEGMAATKVGQGASDPQAHAGGAGDDPHGAKAEAAGATKSDAVVSEPSAQAHAPGADHSAAVAKDKLTAADASGSDAASNGVTATSQSDGNGPHAASAAVTGSAPADPQAAKAFAALKSDMDQKTIANEDKAVASGESHDSLSDQMAFGALPLAALAAGPQTTGADIATGLKQGLLQGQVSTAMAAEQTFKAAQQSLDVLAGKLKAAAVLAGVKDASVATGLGQIEAKAAEALKAAQANGATAEQKSKADAVRSVQGEIAAAKIKVQEAAQAYLAASKPPGANALGAGERLVNPFEAEAKAKSALKSALAGGDAKAVEKAKLDLARAEMPASKDGKIAWLNDKIALANQSIVENAIVLKAIDERMATLKQEKATLETKIVKNIAHQDFLMTKHMETIPKFLEKAHGEFTPMIKDMRALVSDLNAKLSEEKMLDLYKKSVAGTVRDAEVDAVRGEIFVKSVKLSTDGIVDAKVLKDDLAKAQDTHTASIKRLDDTKVTADSAAQDRAAKLQVEKAAMQKLDAAAAERAKTDPGFAKKLAALDASEKNYRDMANAQSKRMSDLEFPIKHYGSLKAQYADEMMKSWRDAAGKDDWFRKFSYAEWAATDWKQDKEESAAKFFTYRMGVFAANGMFKDVSSVTTIEMGYLKDYVAAQQSRDWALQMVKQIDGERTALKLGDAATAKLHEDRYDQAFNSAAPLRAQLSDALKELAPVADKLKGIEAKVGKLSAELSPGNADKLAKAHSASEISQKKTDYHTALKEEVVAKQHYAAGMEKVGALSLQLKDALTKQVEAEAARHRAGMPGLDAAHEAAKSAVTQQWKEIGKAIKPAGTTQDVEKITAKLQLHFSNNLDVLRGVLIGKIQDGGIADRLERFQDFQAAIAGKAGAETAKLLKLIDTVEQTQKQHLAAKGAADAAEKLAGTALDTSDPGSKYLQAGIAEKAKVWLLDPPLGKFDAGLKEALKDPSKRDGIKSGLARDFDNYKIELDKRAQEMKNNISDKKFGLPLDKEKAGTLAYNQSVCNAIDEAVGAAWAQFSKPWRDLGIDTGAKDPVKTVTLATMTESKDILAAAESKAVKSSFATFEGLDAAKLAAAKQDMAGLKAYEAHDAAQRALDTGAQGVKWKLLAAAHQDVNTALNSLHVAKSALAATNPGDAGAIAAAKLKLTAAESLHAKHAATVASIQALSGTTEILKTAQSIASHGSFGQTADLQAKLKLAVDQGAGLHAAPVAEAKAALLAQAKSELAVVKQPADQLQRSIDGLRAQIVAQLDRMGEQASDTKRGVANLKNEMKIETVRDVLEGKATSWRWAKGDSGKIALHSAASQAPHLVKDIYKLLLQQGEQGALLEKATAVVKQAEGKVGAVTALDQPRDILKAFSDMTAASGGHHLRAAAGESAGALSALSAKVSEAAAGFKPGESTATMRVQYEAAAKTVASLSPLQEARAAQLEATQAAMKALSTEKDAITKQVGAHADAVRSGVAFKEAFARAEDFSARFAASSEAKTAKDPAKAALEAMRSPADGSFKDSEGSFGKAESKATFDGSDWKSKTTRPEDRKSDEKLAADSRDELKKSVSDPGTLYNNSQAALLKGLDGVLKEKAAEVAKGNGTFKQAVFDRVLAGGISTAADGLNTVSLLGQVGFKAKAEAYRSDVAAYAAATTALQIEGGAAGATKAELTKGLIATAAGSVYASGTLSGEAKASATVIGIAADVVAKASGHGSLSGSIGLDAADVGISAGGLLVADGSASSKAGIKLGADGLSVKLSASAEASARANFFSKVQLGELGVKDEIRAYAVAKAEASAGASLGMVNGSMEFAAKAGAWAGAAAGVEQTRTIKVWGITVEATGGAYVGNLGASAGVELGYKAGKLTLGVNLGAALGVGLHGNLSITVDFVELINKAETFFKSMAVTDTDRQNISAASAYFKIVGGMPAFLS